MAEKVLMQKAMASGMPFGALLEVYRRGIGAWRTNISSVRLKKDFSKNPNVAKYPRSVRLGKEQWGMARVNAFIEKRPSVYYGSDNDIRQKFGLK